MASADPDGPLTPDERERLAAIRGARSLSALRRVVGADDDHAAYLAAKPVWRELRRRELAHQPPVDGLPGSTVTVDGRRFHVHGVTHADTPAERAYLREHVRRFREDGATVYVEQGIRPMYFADMDGVCEMDDYRWAMAECRKLDAETNLDAVPDFDSIGEQLDSLTDQVRSSVFSLIDDGDGTGEFRRALGDVASDLLTSHETLSTGQDFASFSLADEAARNPERLGELQRYYEAAFLPQPLEREWLRRHDPELELLTHARNERQADYAVYNSDGASDVHLVVGAAHQPGVTYYLHQHRDGVRSPADFEHVE